MSTYFVNAAGSNTAPYETPEKGLPNFAALGSNVGALQTGDIVEVVKDGEIYENMNVTVETSTAAIVTVRSYGLPDAGGKSVNDPDRILNKPLIKIKNDNTLKFSSGGSSGDIRLILQNCTFFKDEAEGTLNNPVVTISGRYQNNVKVENCEFSCRLTIDASRSIGLDIECQVVNNFRFVNNVFRNVSSCLGSNKNIASGIIANNSFFDFTGTAIASLRGTSKAYNNIIHGNSRTGNIALSGLSGALVDYNNIFGVTTAYDGVVSGSHELSVDPFFVNALNGNLHLQASSQCIGTGAGTGVDPNIPVVDYDNVTRPQGTDWDMGAFEYLPPVPTCWEFVAKYLGSNRLFKMNGPGLFPKELKIPKNVDLSTARMIDEGKLIDPSLYRLL